MPVARSLMEQLQRRYGPEEGKRVYYSMEATGKGPFAPGAKYRGLHEAWAEKNGVRPSSAIKAKKKPAASRRQRAKGAKRRR